MNIKPENQIEPILIELNDIIPSGYYIDKHFKKQCLKIGIDVVWRHFLDAAKREFLEETGYCSNEWRLLSTNFDYPTKDTNRVYILKKFNFWN